jgi:hypothetical protein
MKYFIDTEFLEGKQKERFPISLFRTETPNTIDLISIGIVAEDGREYYAISKDFNLKEAWNRYDLKLEKPEDSKQRKFNEYWIRENVLKPIYNELANFHINHVKQVHFGKPTNDIRLLSFNYNNLKWLIFKYGKTNKQIAQEVKDFVNYGEYLKIQNNVDRLKNKPEFYAYYADYDWVAFCWLFGKMIDLPRGFPMFAFDLKQILDEKVEIKRIEWEDNAKNFDMLNHIKTLPNYPKQTNEHNALADASWNFELYKFLEKL